MRSYLILVGIVAFTILGDYALKSAAIKTAPFTTSWFAAGTVLYAVTALGWVFLMQTHNLAQIAVLYSSATILGLTAVGVAFFGETLSLRQIVGLGAALFAVVIMETEA
ncbi:hypothetical protein C8J27_10749 [Rhodobacter aestuarii]|uniref:Uncharacterized protein n=1 Tax=Rhodobacter aestuarii TaxID=453582 RepID=A0A1N7NW73_9RHOB|nr:MULTISPECIES: hypothetical protein [Rhodobacter]PTV94518.1 hypothetical protein C8J27_10749 [Rhodobacter aestuarii]SIT02449.1 hypothetical protein SAMN05421580_108178 [Rhodobacter aestuarii]SOC12271.1 hypothetical protein SAMN05877809_10648 [Rhodobacter sp. JA431]